MTKNGGKEGQDEKKKLEKKAGMRKTAEKNDRMNKNGRKEGWDEENG